VTVEPWALLPLLSGKPCPKSTIQHVAEERYEWFRADHLVAVTSSGARDGVPVTSVVRLMA
jgi:hypothetical protein